MIKGIIFDFDGLIIDTETIWFEAYKETIDELFQKELALDSYATCIGTGNDSLFSLFRQIPVKDVDCEAIEEMALSKYKDKMIKPTLRDGVKAYLQEAQQQDLRIGLASSSSRAWVVGYLDTLGIRSYFEVINTKDDVDFVKPHPQLYLKTLAELGLQPNEAIAFEDSLNGLRAAKQAGMYCVIVPNPVTAGLAFKHYDHKINSMGDACLKEVLVSIQNKEK